MRWREWIGDRAFVEAVLLTAMEVVMDMGYVLQAVGEYLDAERGVEGIFF